MTVLEQKIEKRVAALITGVTPGLQIQVHQAGRKAMDIVIGETYAYYDFASVTKIIFTTQAMMRAYDSGLWNLQSKVSDFLDWFPHKEVKVLECLNHSSGLVWWKAFYENLLPLQEKTDRWQKLKDEIASIPLEKTTASVYSDVGFLVLGFILEKIYERSLLDIWHLIKAEFFPATTMNFHLDNIPQFDRKLYAPTEERGWRKPLLQGEVNDDNAWVLGGVAPHAGLFGSIDDLGWYALHLRALVHSVSKASIRQKTARLFMSRSRPEGAGDWGIGFMMPAKENSLVGNRFSPHSVGHWGFTGTSIWYDPVYDLSVAIASNRTFLGRENKKFNELRPQIHNWIVEGLRRV